MLYDPNWQYRSNPRPRKNKPRTAKYGWYLLKFVSLSLLFPTFILGGVLMAFTGWPYWQIVICGPCILVAFISNQAS